jgi:prefoldin subunit 5
MQSDQQLVAGNLNLLLSELDQSIIFLQETNQELETNNQALQEHLNQMDTTVKHLRQTNRRIAW